MLLPALISANPEFLVYAPSGGNFTVDLSNSSGRFAVEWMNAATGVKSAGADVSGGATRTFTPPFDGDAVLYLRAKASSRAGVTQLKEFAYGASGKNFDAGLTTPPWQRSACVMRL